MRAKDDSKTFLAALLALWLFLFFPFPACLGCRLIWHTGRVLFYAELRGDALRCVRLSSRTAPVFTA